MTYIDGILHNDLFRDSLKKIEFYEKDRIYCKHGIDHLLSVARMSYIISLESDDQIPKERIYIAALLHDIGRVREYENGIPHNEASALIAREILEKINYPEDEINLIMNAISAHRKLSDHNSNRLNAILYRADKMSRNCWSCDARDTCYWDEEKKNKTIDC